MSYIFGTLFASFFFLSALFIARSFIKDLKSGQSYHFERGRRTKLYYRHSDPFGYWWNQALNLFGVGFLAWLGYFFFHMTWFYQAPPG